MNNLVSKIMTILGMIYLMSDVNNEETHFNTIKLTKDYVVINIGMGPRYILGYNKLPQACKI